MATAIKATKTATKAIEVTVAPSEMLAISHKELLKSESAIKASLATIGADGVALQRRVHIAACSVLKRLGEHNDIRLVSALFLILPASYRTNALRDWFAAYGPIAWEQNKPVFVTGKEAKLGAAMVDPFWKFKPEQAYVPADAQKLIDAVIKKLVADQDKGGTHHGATIAALELAKQANKAVTIQ